MRINERGMTLLEVLLALLVLALGLFAAAALQLRALQASEASRQDTQAVQLAQELLERVRAAGALDASALSAWQTRLVTGLGASAHGRARREGHQWRVEIRWQAPGDDAWRIVELPGEVAQ